MPSVGVNLHPTPKTLAMHFNNLHNDLLFYFLGRIIFHKQD